MVNVIRIANLFIYIKFYDCRLEAERKEFYGDLDEGEVYDDSEEGEVYDDSDEDTSDPNEITTEIEEELKLKDIPMNKSTCNISDVNIDAVQDTILDTNITRNEQFDLTVNSSQEELRNNYLPESKEDTSKFTNAKKTGRVSFIEPHNMENTESDIEGEILMSNEKSHFTSKQDKTCNDDSENEDDIIRIEFSHSSHIPNISASSNTEIQSPVDIYKIFSVPKSILKRSPNDMIPNQIVPLNEESSTDAEDEVEYVKHSAYNSVSRNNKLIILINTK